MQFLDSAFKIAFQLTDTQVRTEENKPNINGNPYIRILYARHTYYKIVMIYYALKSMA